MANVDIDPNLTCYQALPGLDDRLTQAGFDYRVLGGTASFPLTLHDTAYHTDNDGHIDIIPGNMSKDPLTILRGNKTRRDVDILIMSTDAQEIEEAGKIVREIAGTVLKVSVFGFDRHEDVMRPAKRVAANLTAFTSKRTIDEAGVHRYVLYPVSHEVRPESYAPATLWAPQNKDQTVHEKLKVIKPVGQLACYMIRSITGERWKDTDKIALLKDNLLSRHNFAYAAKHGDFKEWFEFAFVVAALRGDNAHEYFADDPDISSASITMARARAKLLGTLEGNKLGVKLGQSPTIEKILDLFIGAK